MIYTFNLVHVILPQKDAAGHYRRRLPLYLQMDQVKRCIKLSQSTDDTERKGRKSDSFTGMLLY